MAVQHVSLKDCIDRAEPPAKVLTLSVVDDTVFVSINGWDEKGDSHTQHVKAAIAVSSASLREALQLLADDQVREDLRPLDPPGNDRGERSARIGGVRAGIVKL